jgi:hypothetical protein
MNKLHEWAVKSWKSFAVGATGAIALLAVEFGVTLSPAMQGAIETAITAGGLLLIGLFAKDADKSHTQENKE